MTDAAADLPGFLPDDRLTQGQTLLFAAAALAVVAVYAGGILVALQRPSLPAAAEDAPAAVMVELAPEPVAPEAAAPQLSPDAFDAPEVPEPAPMLPAPVLPEPPPQVAERSPMPPALEPPATEAEVPPQPEVEVPAVPAEIAVARPRARPADLPPPAPPEPEAEKAAPPREEKPSRLARRAAIEAPPAPVAAAPRTSAGGSGQVSRKDWQSRLMAHLERRKRYPAEARARREEGVATVSFTVDASGNVLSARLARSSGFPSLDEAVLALIRRASPVPAPPADVSRQITAPVRFSLR